MLTAKEAREISNNAEYYDETDVYQTIAKTASIGRRTVMFVSFAKKQKIFDLTIELELNGFDVHVKSINKSLTKLLISW